jgi:hypothetical protein
VRLLFSGQNYIVRVQPAFPGMPQAPGEGGAPSDIGPDGGVLPPDAMGPDGLPAGGGEMPLGEDGEDAEAPPFGDAGDDEGEEDEDASEAPGAAGDDEEEGPPPPPPPKGKKKSALLSPASLPAPPPPRRQPGRAIRTYAGLGGQVMTEEQYVRHLAVNLSGHNPAVLAAVREDAR